MKDISPELLNHLMTSDKFLTADLYIMTLKDGTKLRYADFDDYIWFNGNKYIHNSIIISSNGIKTSIGLGSDDLEITIHANKDDKIIGNLSFMQALRVGYLDDTKVDLYVAYLDSSYNVIGAINEFTGILEPKQFSRYSAELAGKSFVQKMDVKLPRNFYTASCINTLYDASCKVDKNAFTRNSMDYTGGGVLDGSTKSHIKAGLATIFADGYYTRGAIEFISGDNIGIRTTIKEHLNGIFVLSMPLPYPVKTTDAFFIYAGCDKTMATCKNKFNNFSQNRAFPFVPAPETAT